MTKKQMANFWKKVDSEGGKDACWPWLGGLDRWGYGSYSYSLGAGVHKTEGSHRIAWRLTNERSIPPGMCVCHTCDFPACCNPKHLWLGTREQNTADAMKKGRLRGRKKVNNTPTPECYKKYKNPRWALVKVIYDSDIPNDFLEEWGFLSKE